MRKKGVLLGVSVLLVVASVLLAGGQVGQDGRCWTSRETIYIYGNQAFTCDNGVVSGCGTKESPFVIEGWRIVTCGADFGINIANTSSYFVIRNCVIEGASAGIHFVNVSNGAIECCLLLRNDRGILLENSHFNGILGNLVAENRIGADLTLGSRENTATGNSFVLNARTAHDPGGRNLWYCGLAGNYWSDYEGTDGDCDGIGDAPYHSPVVDRYPLIVSPWQCTLPITEQSALHCETSTTVLKEIVVDDGPCEATCAPTCAPTRAPTCAPVCAPSLTVCADQVLTCAQPEVTLSADYCPSRPACEPCTYEWTRAGFGIVGHAQSIVVSEPGTYTVTVTGDDRCSVCGTVVVVADFGTASVTATVDGELSCARPQVTLESHVSGACAPYTIEWIRGGVVIGRDDCVSVCDPGTYTVRVTSDNGCTSLATVDVVRDVRVPSVQASADRLLSCAVTETDLRAKATGGTPPYTYEWKDASQRVIGTDPVVTVHSAGTYTVRVAGHNGCSAIADVIVTEDVEAPIVHALVDGTITCNNKEVTLTANISRGRAPYTIEWRTPSGITICKSATIVVDEAGTYTVTVTGSNGCSTSDSVEVIEDTEPPLVDAGENQAITLEDTTAVLTATIDRCPGPYTVTWTNTMGEVVGHTESITVNRSGVYTVTVVRHTGCTASDEVTVTSDYVSEVVLTSNIEGLAVFGQLTMDGVPIPETVFYFQVEEVQTGSETGPATITMTGLLDQGYRANGAEVYYIIPGNSTVEFGIHQDQFVVGKKYYLLHLPTDPPGEAAVAFF